MFMGVPRSAVVNFLKNQNNKLAINFTIEGTSTIRSSPSERRWQHHWRPAWRSYLGSVSVGSPKERKRSGGRESRRLAGYPGEGPGEGELCEICG